MSDSLPLGLVVVVIIFFVIRHLVLNKGAKQKEKGYSKVAVYSLFIFSLLSVAAPIIIYQDELGKASDWLEHLILMAVALLIAYIFSVLAFYYMHKGNDVDQETAGKTVLRKISISVLIGIVLLAIVAIQVFNAIGRDVAILLDIIGLMIITYFMARPKSLPSRPSSPSKTKKSKDEDDDDKATASEIKKVSRQAAEQATSEAVEKQTGHSTQASTKLGQGSAQSALGSNSLIAGVVIVGAVAVGGWYVNENPEVIEDIFDRDTTESTSTSSTTSDDIDSSLTCSDVDLTEQDYEIYYHRGSGCGIEKSLTSSKFTIKCDVPLAYWRSYYVREINTSSKKKIGVSAKLGLYDYESFFTQCSSPGVKDDNYSQIMILSSDPRSTLSSECTKETVYNKDDWRSQCLVSDTASNVLWQCGVKACTTSRSCSAEIDVSGYLRVYLVYRTADAWLADVEGSLEDVEVCK